MGGLTGRGKTTSARLMVLALALGIAATPWQAAVAAGGSSPGLAGSPTALAESQYLQEADTIDAQAASQLFYGQVLAEYFDASGNVVGTGGHGDAAIWTGHYLASQAFRYAVARAYLGQHVGTGSAGNPGEPGQPKPNPSIAAWQARLEDAKANVMAAFIGLHRDVNIAANWVGPSGPSLTGGCGDRYTHPSQCPTMGNNAVDAGQAGLLMRMCAPDSAPAYVFGDQGNGVTPNIEWTDQAGPEAGIDQKWHCKAQISRDQYMGTMLGMLAAFDMVGPDDPQLKADLAHDITTMTSYLVNHGWGVFYPDGDLPSPSNSNANGWWFYYPLFDINPLERMHMVAGARHVADVTGQNQAYWDALWAQEVASDTPELTGEYMLAIDAPHQSYYKFNLDYASNFDVLREETNATFRQQVKQQFSELDASMSDDVNAHFEAVTYAVTGDRWRLNDAVRDLISWIPYRDRTTSSVTNSTRCKSAQNPQGDLRCVTDDYVNLDQPTPQGGPTVEVATQSPATAQNGSNPLRSTTPLALVDRPESDFIWQRSPFTLDGAWSPNGRDAGVDYVLPYWMIRYYSEVAPPLAESLPPWVGPTGGNSYSNTVGPPPITAPSQDELGKCAAPPNPNECQTIVNQELGGLGGLIPSPPALP